jgi:hypothetical protein
LAQDGPLWSRHFAGPGQDDACALLRETLAVVGADRMVIGHTPQMGGIRSRCGDQVRGYW